MNTFAQRHNNDYTIIPLTEKKILLFKIKWFLFIELESPFPKDALYQVWLFYRRIFLNFINVSLPF